MAKETKKTPAKSKKPAPAKSAAARPASGKSAAAKPASGKPAAGKSPARKGNSAVHLPVLLEMTFTTAAIVVLLVGVVTGVVSFLAGCPAWVIGLRAGGAILTVGLVFYGIAFCMSRGTVETNHAMREELVQELQKESVPSTVERVA